MSDAIATKNPIVYIGGQELSEANRNLLVETRIELGLRLPGRVTLRFQDPKGALAQSGTFALGGKVQVKGVAGPVIIDAEITGLGYAASTGVMPQQRFDGRTSAVNELVVTAYDRSHRLTRNRTVGGFTQMSASDIATRLARAAGLTPVVTATSTQYPSITQVHTDFELLNALADRAAVDWWTAPGDKLHFQKLSGTTTLQLRLGTRSLENFTVQASGLRPDAVSVRGWLSEQQQSIKGDATVAASDVWPSTRKLVPDFKSAGDRLARQGNLITSRLSPVSVEESTTIAKGLADRIAAASVVARGRCEGNPKIALGVNMQVQGAGPIDGTYLVTEVEHVVRPHSYKTMFVAGDRSPASLADLINPGEASFPLLRDGLVIGKVESVGDGEDKGKIRVTYPGVDADMVSAWARFLALGAGGDNARGLVMLPERDDEVLVGFEGGDVHRPVILGGLYASGDKVGLWDVAEGVVMSRHFLSRRGHSIEFKDGKESAPADNYVKINVAKSETGPTSLRVGADAIEVTAPAQVPITLTSGDAKVTLAKDGSISVEGLKIELKGTQEVSIAAPNVTIKADTKLALEGSATAELKGGAVDVTGTGKASVKAAMVQIN